jgi:tetratricopeptide (TPR) repeat protein
MLKQLLVSVVLTLSVAPYAVADDNTDWIKDTSGVGDSDSSKTAEWIKDTSKIGQSNNGYVRSDQILELGTCPPSALQLEGEHAMRIGNLDTALTALQRSVEMAPLDVEKRLLYAQCLEKKLMKQKKKDPALYNFLIKQYLFIYRKAEFVDQTMQARAQLVHLTGTAPKMFEKSEKFLSRVLIPEDGSEKVAIKNKPVPSAE